MIKSIIKYQDKLVNRARFFGNHTLRPVLVFNAAYIKHKGMTGRLSDIGEDDLFCQAYYSRLKYMLDCGKDSIKQREKVTLEEFLCWKDEIFSESEHSIPSWFLEEQTKIMGHAVNSGLDNSKVISKFNRAYCAYPRITAGGNAYVFRIKFQNKLDTVSRTALNFLEKYKSGAEQKINYNLLDRLFGIGNEAEAELV